MIFWCIVGCVIRIILYFVIIPDNLFGYGLGSNSYQYTFWIYFLLHGFAVGMNVLTLTAMLAPIMPHNLTGSIIGGKVCISYWIKAGGALLVGCLWDISHNWLWYGTGLFVAASLILLLVIVVVEKSNAYRL